MSSSPHPQPTSESTQREDRPLSHGSRQRDVRTTQDQASIVRPGAPNQIVIDGQNKVYLVVFLGDGKYIASRDGERYLRRWRVKDGAEAGTVVSVEEKVHSFAVAQDGKWIVVGTGKGSMEVWDAETNRKVISFTGHSNRVSAVDMSLDGTKIATGSDSGTVCVWSRETGRRLLESWKHDNWLAAVKFSPDARLIATATWKRDSLRVYDAINGGLLFDVPIRVGSANHGSLTWASNDRLFVLSREGNIHYLDASTGSILVKWPIHASQDAMCIALASNGAFIAASARSSVSFWDASTHKQVGSVIQHTHDIWSMAISDNFDLVTSGETRISLHSLRNTLPLRYLINDAKLSKELRVLLSDPQEAPKKNDDIFRIIRTQEKASSNVSLTRIPLEPRPPDDHIVRLEKNVQELRDELAKSQGAARKSSKTISTLRSQEASANAQIRDLKKTVEELRNQLALSQSILEREQEVINSLHVREENSMNENICLKCRADRLDRIIHIHEQKHRCEVLYSQDSILDAVESLLEIEDTMNEDIKGNKFLCNWFTEFKRKCINSLEKVGDEASHAKKWDEGVAAYAAALSLSPLASNAVLMPWARMILTGHSWREALGTAIKFKTSRFDVYRVVCDVLEEEGRLTEAIECFCQRKSELPEDMIDDERVEWEHDFRGRCVEKLVKLGDTASDTKKYQGAIGFYSDALLLEPVDSSKILLKRSSELIKLDPSSHKGYEEKHAALHSMGCYKEAFEAFLMMRSKAEQLSDPNLQNPRHQYLDITPFIRQAAQQTLSLMPRVLIDTGTGRVYDKQRQAAMFEEHSIFDELRSSMTTWTRLDHARIRDEVKKFYRYVMFSHRWENGEPLFHDVQNISIYELESSSPANAKLQMLCKVVYALGFRWVWSDTCCIDKENNVVLQESLVAMFTWYRGSSLTLIYLRGVWSDSQEPGDLQRSAWNTRVWTYQEYVAAATVQFYTEDWKPYLNLEIFNHKESSAVIAEMERASGVSSQQLAILRPGLDRVREKLSLASTRETTFVEDIAYSLLSVFNASIPVIYGERYRAVSRLLEHVLTGSGDTSILAWTGHAGDYNSCLPLDLTVYSQVVPSHIPLPMETGDMYRVVTTLRSSPQFDCGLLDTLYNRLRYLQPPFMAASRLRLSGFVFRVPEVICTSDADPETKVNTYRATISVLGDIEIRTTENLCGMKDLCLVHPWIRPLLIQEHADGTAALDKTTQALRLLARLRQPFGALLFEGVSLLEHKRVAADSLIMVQIREEASLTELIDSIDTVEVQ